MLLFLFSLGHALEEYAMLRDSLDQGAGRARTTRPRSASARTSLLSVRWKSFRWAMSRSCDRTRGYLRMVSSASAARRSTSPR